MAGSVRERMVEAAERLLAERGLSGASFPEVLEITGASRGSVYHYFPDGKDQLVVEALEFAEVRMHVWLEAKRGVDPAELVSYYFHIWSEMLRRSRFVAGCSATAVMTAARSPELIAAAARSFDLNRAHLAELLREGGMPAEETTDFASLLVASAEGAVLLSRGAHSLDQLNAVAKQLVDRATAHTN